jgi:diadenosine tetraphosphatase ApaH/serine/threonine PP2A family protein phosphatase
MLQLRESASKVDAAGFANEVEKAAGALQAERQRKSIAGGRVAGSLIELQDLRKLVIVSDLHGDIKSLFATLDQINYEQFLADPLNKLVFMGDYVDRGSDSIGVMYAVCRLKAAYPDSVILMRGNHESPAEFPFSSHDLPYKMESRFGADAKAAYNKLLSMFRLLTLAVVVKDGLLLVHGGLPTEPAAIANFEESISAAQENHIKSRVLEELLWNDPRPLGGEWEPSRRGIGRHFGAEITRNWLDSTKTKAVVRGHEPCQGFRVDHDGMVMTLFSCTDAYPKFKAAYLALGAEELAGVTNAHDLARYARFLS